MTIDDLWRQDTNQMKELLKYAYLDIKYLLAEGFDVDVKNHSPRYTLLVYPELEGVKDTIEEIEMVVGKKNLEEFIAKSKEDNNGDM